MYRATNILQHEQIEKVEMPSSPIPKIKMTSEFLKSGVTCPRQTPAGVIYHPLSSTHPSIN